MIILCQANFKFALNHPFLYIYSQVIIKRKQSLGKKPQQGEKMINNQSRQWRQTGQYEPENTWDRLFSYSNTKKVRGRTEPWWYDEK